MHQKVPLILGIAVVIFAGCSGRSGTSPQSDNSGTNSSGISLTLTPATATVVVGQSAAFQASVTGAADTAVTWEVNGVPGGSASSGTINAGVYTAPTAVPNPSMVTITAVAQANTNASKNAIVLVVASNPNQAAQNIPIKLGTSGGNSNDSTKQGNLIYCCGGTLGSLLQRNGTYYILSNNHVLARSDSATIGDPITQPDLIDANCSTIGTTTVANLTQYVDLRAPGTNVDAAIAQIVPGTVDTTGTILSVGALGDGGTPDSGAPHAGNGITAYLGEGVAKSGRSSGLTCSSPSTGAGVDAIDVTTSVSYQKGCNKGGNFNVTYTHQISVAGGTFSAAGDSGSLIIDENTADPVALLYGGSDTDTVGNPVADVLTAMQDGQGNKPTFVGTNAPHQVSGCTAVGSALRSAQALSAPPLSSAQLAEAQHARDMHAPELLSNPSVQAVGIGQSLDHPGEAAVVVVIDPAQPASTIPARLDGVATRIVAGTAAGSNARGVLDLQTTARIAPANNILSVTSISKAEVARAQTVHAAHAALLMTQPGIQGVGITSSADAPGEAALMLFVVRGVPRNPIPIVIDGLRTRIRESSRFTAGRRSNEQAAPGCRVPASHAAHSF
jgi:hypothetical protein